MNNNGSFNETTEAGKLQSKSLKMHIHRKAQVVGTKLHFEMKMQEQCVMNDTKR